MFGTRRGSAQGRTDNTWPGFVDALASLLMVIIFVLMIFMVAQFYLSNALTGQDEALQELRSRVTELSSLLQAERQANEDLRDNVAQLSQELQQANAAQEQLQNRVASLQSRNQELTSTVEDLRGQTSGAQEQVADLRAELEESEEELSETRQALSAAEEQAEDRAAENEALRQDIADLRAIRDQLRQEVVQLDEQLAAAQNRAQTAETSAEDQRQRATQAEAEVAELNRRLANLQDRLARIQAALEASEERVAEQNVEIQNLSSRLNEALIDRVAELSRYRSEFFQQLSSVLENNPNVRVEGDRFVFQSEVLFATGSAQLGQGTGGGEATLGEVSNSLLSVIDDIPEDIDWILRVDGHTDVRPIQSAQFPSNWELSTQRSVNVVRSLIDDGIPPQRLAACGFAQYQPIAEGQSEEAYRRNRRIEFKLTEQ